MNWTALLERLIERPCFDRPFVCDGTPDESRVLIVGENPATDVTTDWWRYWDETRGFDHAAFMRDYLVKRPRLNGARLRFNYLRTSGIKAVETNFYRDQNLNGSIRKVLNTPLLQVLIDNMPHLEAVLFHGGKAQRLAPLLRIPDKVLKVETRHFRIERRDVILKLLASDIPASG